MSVLRNRQDNDLIGLQEPVHGDSNSSCQMYIPSKLKGQDFD